MDAITSPAPIAKLPSAALLAFDAAALARSRFCALIALTCFTAAALPSASADSTVALLLFLILRQSVLVAP